MKNTILTAAAVTFLAGAASAVPVVDGDFGYIMGGAEQINGNLRRDDVDWYSFDVGSAATYVDIFTYQRRNSGVDTEIGVFAADGMLVASDDDDGRGLRSALSFGAGSGTSLGGGNAITGTGQDGAMLGAGQYFVSVSRFNTIFDDDFDVDAPTRNARDRYGITIKTDVAPVPLPAALPLMGFAIAGLGALGARRKKTA